MLPTLATPVFRPMPMSRCGAAIAYRMLLAEDEVQPDAGDFDEIAVVQAHGAGDGSAVDVGNLVAGTEVVAIIALIDLRGHLWFEPALEANGGHGGFSDDGEFVGQNILFLIGLAAENDKCRNFHASRGKLHGFAHGGSLLEHLAAFLSVQHHGFVDARRCGFAAGVPGHRRIAAGIDLDFVFSDMDVVAIVQSSALDTAIVHKSAVEAVEIFNDHAAGLEIDFRVIVGYGEVIDGQVVVRGAANGYGPAAHGNLFHDLVVKHEAELRHLNFLQCCHLNLDFWGSHGATTKTTPWNPFRAAPSRP